MQEAMKKREEARKRREERIAQGLPPETDEEVAARENREKMLAEKRKILGQDEKGAPEGSGEEEAEDGDMYEEYIEEEKEWVDDPEETFTPRVLAVNNKAVSPDARPHANIVFVGHVDAGKSTTCGNILYLSGNVDERTIEKYQREAKEKNRDSWFLAYILDTSDEEKEKGKTIEVGRATFNTPTKRFHILDAPGHKSYVPNMIAGAAAADVGVLIISARKGEFETGFERGGQSGEHAILCKTLGVDRLIVAINKMDDPTVEWSKARYDDIVGKLKPHLIRNVGFDEDQLTFMPLSGLNGDNVKDRKNTPEWAWDSAPPLLELFDNLEIKSRTVGGPFRMPMLDGYRDAGAVTAIGKVEQGCVKPGMKCVVQPLGKPCTVAAVFIDEAEVHYAKVGESVTLKMETGLTEDDLRKGYVIAPLGYSIR